MATKYLPQFIQPKCSQQKWPASGQTGAGSIPPASEGRQDSATSPTVITRENNQLDDLYFILDGNLTIEKGGQRAPSESRTFIGEIAFLLSRPATATVTLEPGSRYFARNAKALHHLLHTKPALSTALSAVMNKKLAQKIARAGVLMNTAGLDYRAP